MTDAEAIAVVRQMLANLAGAKAARLVLERRALTHILSLVDYYVPCWPDDDSGEWVAIAPVAPAALREIIKGVVTPGFCGAGADSRCSIENDSQAILFLPCGRKSWHPKDVENRWCSACGKRVPLAE